LRKLSHFVLKRTAHSTLTTAVFTCAATMRSSVLVLERFWCCDCGNEIPHDSKNQRFRNGGVWICKGCHIRQTAEYSRLEKAATEAQEMEHEMEQVAYLVQG
jgi:hypothetical protein